MRLFAVFIPLFFFSLLVAQAADTENERSSLRGLEGVKVLVERIDPDVEHNGLTTGAIQTDVELKLRQAGISVWAPDQQTHGRPTLYVAVQVYTGNFDPIWGFHISVDLRQDAKIECDPLIGQLYS